jgi:hypothetical protein
MNMSEEIFECPHHALSSHLLMYSSVFDFSQGFDSVQNWSPYPHQTLASNASSDCRASTQTQNHNMIMEMQRCDQNKSGEVITSRYLLQPLRDAQNDKSPHLFTRRVVFSIAVRNQMGICLQPMELIQQHHSL